MDKKLKIVCVALKSSKLLPAVVKQEDFFRFTSTIFFTLFLQGGKNHDAKLQLNKTLAVVDKD